MKRLFIFFISLLITFQLYADDDVVGSKEKCGCEKKSPVSYKRAVEYPICFYDVELGAVAKAKSAWPSYSGKLSRVIFNIVGNENDFTIIDSRRIVIRTFSWKHREIRSIWPSLACIGQTGGGDSLERNTRCVVYIKKMLNATSKGIVHSDSDLAPICQTFLDSSPPLNDSLEK
ncbi:MULTISPECIES: hypothetical protein [Enterobacter]|uniref:hypothetical protein n=1 Tax=Enterobacter TaxID=547 RepID=UPI00188997E9|nr:MULTISPECIES: hypothetical protein [Enterobacter]MBF2790035.1 hypothetical protein [Enterobacter asburiae]